MDVVHTVCYGRNLLEADICKKKGQSPLIVALIKHYVCRVYRILPLFKLHVQLH